MLRGEVGLYVIGGVLVASLLVREAQLLVVGLILALVAAVSWIWQRYCLVGLGYRRSLGQQRAVFGEEVSLTLEIVNDKPAVIPFYDYQRFGIGPNGAVNSSVNDMLKYLAFHMGDGTANGKQVLSPAQFAQIHRAITADRDLSYAMGWIVDHRGGHRLLLHDGSINGFTAQMSLIPDMHTAIIVLNNTESALPSTVANGFLNRELGLPTVDLVERIKQNVAASSQREIDAAKAFEGGRLPNAPASLPLAAYTGDWVHPAFGTVHVEIEGEKLAVHFDALTLQLTHYNYDTFATKDRRVATFHLNPQGKPIELLLPLESTVKPFVFTRKP